MQYHYEKPDGTKGTFQDLNTVENPGYAKIVVQLDQLNRWKLTVEVINGVNRIVSDVVWV